jgi:hypothetical protein
MRKRWYYCLEHDRVEPRKGCAAKYRLGPYDTAEEASEALEKVKMRNAKWNAEDQRWEGRK